MTTTDHLYELHTSIVAALSGDATLSAMVNGVYGNVPTDVKYPFVAVDSIVAEDIITRTTSGWNIRVAIKTLSRSRSNKEASNILAEIRRILDNAALVPTGCKISSIREHDSNISRLSDGITWHGTIGFSVILQQGSAFAASGNNFLIKIGNGATPTETFTTIGGLRGASLSLANNLVNCSNISTGKWQKLVSSAGIAGIAIGGTGYFTDSAAEEALRSAAFSASANNYEIIFGNNDKISGAFIVAGYKRAGNNNGLEEFSVSLESSGVVTFTSG